MKARLNGLVGLGRGRGGGEVRVVPGRGRGSFHTGGRILPAYSMTMPRPMWRLFSSVEPRTQTPGEFISTMASTRSATARERTSTALGLGTGLPSIAMTRKVWPGSARTTFSVALALSRRQQDASGPA